MRKLIKIILYCIGSILLLIVLFVLLLQTPWGKNLVRKKTISYLEDKLKTQVSVGQLDYKIPDNIDLKDVLLLDRQKDTLLFAGHLKVDMNLWGLIRHKLTINEILLEGIDAHLYRPIPDSLFNYQFIIDAFAASDTEVAPTQTEKANKSTLTYDIRKVILNDIRFRYDDHSGGALFSIALNKLLLRPKNMDLDKMIFSVSELNISGLQSFFASDSAVLPPPPEDTSAPADLQLSVDKLQLNQVNFALRDRTDSFYLNVDIGFLKTKLKHFGLLEELVAIGNLQIENTQSAIVMGKSSEDAEEAGSASDTTANHWRVLADNIALKQIQFELNDNSQPRQKPGIDYAHLHIQQFFFNAADLVYGPDTISGNIKHLALKEQSGLNVLELRSKVFYYSQGAQLNDLYLLTPHTLLQHKLAIAYPSLSALQSDMNRMKVDIALNKSIIGMEDLLLFLPTEQQKELQSYKKQSLYAEAKMKGYLNALLVDRLYLSGLSGTVVDLKGKLNGLPDPEKLYYDLYLRQVRTTYRDIAPFLPDSLKQQYRFPEWMSVAGTLRGTTMDYYPVVLVKSADGDATVKGNLRLSPGKDQEQYDLALGANRLNLGRILKMDSILGPMTLTANVKGTGFDPDHMNAVFDAQIQSLFARGYAYNHIRLNGSIAEKLASLAGLSTDPNLDIVFQATAALNDAYPAVKGNLNMNNVDLFALKFVDDSLRLAGDLYADLTAANPDYPSGTFFWANPRIAVPDKSIRLDSISFTSSPSADSAQDIYLNASGILQATLQGHMPLTQMGNAVLSHINRHYQLSDTNIQTLPEYDMNLAGYFNYHPALQSFLPELKPFDTIKFSSGLSPDTFSFNAFIPRLGYGQNQMDSGRISIHENRDTFSYFVALKKLNSGAMQLWYPSLRGRIRQDSIYALVNIKDSVGKNQFTLGGAMNQNSSLGLTYIRLFKGLRFNYERWNVNPANRIVIDSAGFYIRDFDLSKDNQSISIASKQETANAPFDILIRNFRLANIMQMISQDTLLADGILAAQASIDLRDSFPRMNAQLSIDQLKAYNQDIGQVEMTVKNETAAIYRANLALTGNGNDVRIAGAYYLKPLDSNDFDFNLDINPLSLQSVQGLAFGAIKNSGGALSGKLNIKGTTTRPVITGELHTNQLETTVSALNAYFKMPNEKIVFERRKILFDQFHIEDATGQKATLDGSIRTRSFKTFFLDLQLKANKWQALHSTKKDNASFYGDLVFSADLTAKGLATTPDVQGNITIHDSTKLHYALLDEGPGIVESDGIVAFVNTRDTLTVDSATIPKRRRIRFSASTQMNVNVDVEKGAQFTVLIDPASGDQIQVQGESALNTFIGPDGSIGLTGTYELNDGFYELNYNFLRRKFKIQKGSVIRLAGSPLEAEADITATYDANIAPYDLVENQATPEQLIYYKQRLPFQVVLKLTGKVMKPDIAFDIILPEDKASMVSSDVSSLVQAKLARMRTNPSEMNKQVFAILILGRFIAEDPFASGAGIDVEYVARQSVSKFLSEQLNQIAGQLIKGLEVNFDLNSAEDYSTGTKANRTDLSVSASKSLMDNRLKITVGNDFQLEGPTTQRQQSNLIPGNLSADYQLTKDGRYFVRAYRSNQLQNIIEGYVVETGVAFRISLEYNKFKYLFINRKKYFQKMRERRKAEQKQEQKENADQQ